MNPNSQYNQGEKMDKTLRSFENRKQLSWFCCCFSTSRYLFSRQALEHVFEHTYNHIFSLTHTLMYFLMHMCTHMYIHTHTFMHILFLKKCLYPILGHWFCFYISKLRLELSKNFKRVLIKTRRVLFTSTRRKTVRVTHSGFHSSPPPCPPK